VASLIPCHTVLRKDGSLGGYHWGVDRKRAMLAWQGVRAAQVAGAARPEPAARALLRQAT